MRRMAPALMAAMLCAACGKKGPPLPPLVKLPAAPAELTAERRGDDVTVQFTVPGANTDDSRPANVTRVDVYALTASTAVTGDQLVTHGTRIASVDVKAPRDPDETVEAGESEADVEAPVGPGLDQGSRAVVTERLTAAALVPVDLAADVKQRPRGEGAAGPLLGPMGRLSRTYAGVGISTRGKKGPVSARIAVPLGAPPAAPPTPSVTYDESAITVSWPAPGSDDTAGLLPSHPLGVAAPTLAYHVYEVAPPPAAETRLTGRPVPGTTYADKRMTWGVTRCYAVRALLTIGTLEVESDEAPAACVTLRDTFPPAAPKGLTGVASAGTISLIWEASTDKDLAGYLVLRGVAASGALEPVTPAPVQASVYNDTVQAGVRYTYAIVAVDHAGNRSAPSNRFEETAR